MRQLRSVRIEQDQQQMPIRFPRLKSVLNGYPPHEFAAALSDPTGLNEVLDIVAQDFVHCREDGAMVDAALAVVAVNALSRGLGRSQPASFQWRGPEEMLTLRISAQPLPRSTPQYGEGVYWTERADTELGRVQLIVEGSGLDIIASAAGKAEVDAAQIILSEGPALDPDDLEHICPGQLWVWGLLELVDNDIDGMDCLILSAAMRYLWGRMTIVNMSEANLEHHGVHIDGASCGGVYLQLRRRPLPVGVDPGFGLSI